MSLLLDAIAAACPVCEDVRDLLDQREVQERIAARMGRNREGLHRHLRHHDPALLERFKAARYTDALRYSDVS